MFNPSSLLSSLPELILSGMIDIAFAVGLYLWYERRRAKSRIRKHIGSWIRAAEFEWKNQTQKFVADYRVQAFERLLRNMQGVLVWSAQSEKLVQEVKDAIEFFHRGGTTVRNNQVLPLPELGKFPLPAPTPEEALLVERTVRAKIIERLSQIKWIDIDKIRKAVSSEGVKPILS